MTTELDRLRLELRQHLWDVGLKWAEGVDGDLRPMAWTLDCRELVLSSQRIRCVGRLLWELVREYRADMVGGLTMSADALVAAVLEEAARDGVALDGLIVRPEPKAHGLRKRIEGPPVQQRARVVVVDDVVSSGRALLTAQHEIRAEGGDVVGAAVLVDFRHPRTVARLAKARLPVRALFDLAELGLRAVADTRSAQLTPAWRWEGARTSGERLAQAGPCADPGHNTLVVSSETGAVTAFSVAGSPRWQRALAWPIRTAPAVSGEHVLVGDGLGVVHGLDAGTGATVWTSATGGHITAGPSADGVVAVAGSTASALVALNTRSGARRWRVQCPSIVHAGPLAVARHGAVVVGDAAGRVTAVDARDGRPRWAVRTGGDVRGHLVMASADTVLATSYDGSARAVDASTGQLRWCRRLSAWLYNATVVVGDMAAIGADANVIAVDGRDGTTVWVTPIGGRVIGAPARVGDRWLAVGTERGELALLDARSGETAHTVSTGAPIRATPAVLAGLIGIVTATGDVMAFRVQG